MRYELREVKSPAITQFDRAKEAHSGSVTFTVSVLSRRATDRRGLPLGEGDDHVPFLVVADDCQVGRAPGNGGPAKQAVGVPQGADG